MMTSNRKRLAIIGAGSSGLVSLKYAKEALPDWQIDCFEQSDNIVGAWGSPYPGFVSTSTKYTTQFSCFPEYGATVEPDGGAQRCEFFRDGEFGEYLGRFADHYGLRPHIRHQHRTISLRRDEQQGGWEVTYVAGDAPPETVHYDVVIICTGLVAEPKSLGPHVEGLLPPALRSGWDVSGINGKRVVVAGGGEMGADFVNQLAKPDRGNQVFLSLRTGIRLSPRYHPIRGVPSDFLRNRLLLSIHLDIRNWIGKRFVSARIRYQNAFKRLFPATVAREADAPEVDARRKLWATRLHERASQQLFDMFHNKSDDFLGAIAEERITVVGPAVEGSPGRYHSFEGDEIIDVNPEVIVPAIGFRSRLGDLTGGVAELRDFYHACCHVRYDDLYLVGYARPVIGNIPSISEIQARYVTQMIAGNVARPDDIAERHAADVAQRSRRFGKVDTNVIYPVEMFPYCDRLAEEMGIAPRPRTWREWWRTQTAPATTLDYESYVETRSHLPRPPTYLPMPLILFLLALKPVDWVYRLVRPGR